MSIIKKFDYNTNNYKDIRVTVSGSGVLAGDFVTVGSLRGFYAADADVGDVAAVVVDASIARAQKATGALAVGVPVYWHSSANPINGTAGTGAVNGTAASGVLVGFVREAALSGDAEVVIIFEGDAEFLQTTLLAELTDVDVSTPPTNGQVLKFNGTKWAPAADAT